MHRVRKSVVLIIIFAISLCSAQSLYAFGAGSLIDSINIQINKDFMHYAEYSPNGQVLDTESGNLPGFGVSLEGLPDKRIPVWCEVNLHTNYGDSNYKGSIEYYNLGFKVIIPETNTDHLFYINYGGRLGYAFFLYKNRIAVIPDLGFENVNWNRNIEPANIRNIDVPGYIEHYRLNYYMLGAKIYYTAYDRLWLEGELYYIHGFSNSMNTVLPISAASSIATNYNLGSKSGYLLGFKIGYHANKILNPFIGVNYIKNEEGRSNIINLGNGLFINEPSDRYKQLLVDFGLKILF